MTSASCLSNFRTVENVLPTEAGIAAALRRAIDVLRRAGLDKAHLFSIELSIHEALVNALVHGVQERGASQIRLAYEIDGRSLRAVVEDDGAEGITHDAGETPPEGYGRGLFLIRAFTSRVCSQGRIVSMELDLDAAPRPRFDHVPPMIHAGSALLC